MHDQVKIFDRCCKQEIGRYAAILTNKGFQGENKRQKKGPGKNRDPE